METNVLALGMVENKVVKFLRVKGTRIMRARENGGGMQENKQTKILTRETLPCGRPGAQNR